MKSLSLLCVGLVALSPVSFAQEGGEIDIEARKATIPVLESHLKEREERVKEIANDIMAIDRRLEKKIDRVVEQLASVRDSAESKYRISQVKRKAMDGLLKTIKDYQHKRTELIRDIRRGKSQIPREVLEKDVEKFDHRVEKRVAQIVQLSESFTQDAKVKKYEVVEGSYDPWGWGETTRITDEYKQNRRDRSMDKKKRDEMTQALEKSIKRLESHIVNYKDNLENRNLTPSDRELAQAELARTERILKSRREQLAGLDHVAQPDTKSVDREAALEIQRALKDNVGDLRRDFEMIFIQYAELNSEREKTFRLKKNIADRKKWIEDYEARQ